MKPISKCRIAIAIGICLAAGVAFAQSHQPYAGLQDRSIKALSEQQVADLKAGRGMGLALAAELNGYPGPLHVVELSDKLGLTAEQLARAQQLFESMKQEAIPLGARLIEQEADLDRQFAGRTITLETLKAATTSIAITQGRLREGHLKYHLATAAILTPVQMQQYQELRGYGGDEGRQQHHRPH
jgi:Spy/CpxP family protein refolding chaperone